MSNLIMILLYQLCYECQIFIRRTASGYALRGLHGARRAQLQAIEARKGHGEDEALVPNRAHQTH